GKKQAAAKLRQAVAYRALLQAETFRLAKNRSAVDANLRLLRETTKFLPPGKRIRLSVMHSAQVLQAWRARLKLRTRAGVAFGRLTRLAEGPRGHSDPTGDKCNG